ncbi:MAG: hypothetical protein HKN27_07630 [Silicimonas sp.]|nr:hypothetical protein [Silicimonas sp.]
MKLKAMAGLALILLAGCATRETPPGVKCMFEVKPEGSYAKANTPGARFVPAKGGSQAEADALNACMDRRGA